MVFLSNYTEKFKNQLLHFELPPEQKQYTALPEDVLEQASYDPNRFPIVITIDNDLAVGFFILHIGSEISTFTSETNSILLRSFSINFNQQGKGYALATMKELSLFVSLSFPSIKQIVLAVNEKNIAAQRLYEKAGFYDTGNRVIGKIGPQLILKKEVG